MALKKMTVLRHGIAVPTWTGMTYEQDIGRMLSSEGHEGIVRRRTTLGVTHYGVVLVSPTCRTEMTAIALMGQTDLDAMRHIKELCYDNLDTPRGKWLAAQYQELGFKPYRVYYQRDTENHLGKQGSAALRQCLQAAEDASAEHALVVTHMPILPCLGLSATAGVSRKWDKTFLDYAFKEGEGFTLTMEGRMASDVEFHIN